MQACKKSGHPVQDIEVATRAWSPEAGRGGGCLGKVCHVSYHYDSLLNTADRFLVLWNCGCELRTGTGQRHDPHFV